MGFFGGGFCFFLFGGAGVVGIIFFSSLQGVQATSGDSRKSLFPSFSQVFGFLMR